MVVIANKIPRHVLVGVSLIQWVSQWNVYTCDSVCNIKVFPLGENVKSIQNKCNVCNIINVPLSNMSYHYPAGKICWIDVLKHHNVLFTLYKVSEMQLRLTSLKWHLYYIFFLMSKWCIFRHILQSVNVLNIQWYFKSPFSIASIHQKSIFQV